MREVTQNKTSSSFGLTKMRAAFFCTFVMLGAVNADFTHLCIK